MSGSLSFGTQASPLYQYVIARSMSMFSWYIAFRDSSSGAGLVIAKLVLTSGGYADISRDGVLYISGGSIAMNDYSSLTIFSYVDADHLIRFGSVNISSAFDESIGVNVGGFFDITSSQTYFRINKINNGGGFYSFPFTSYIFISTTNGVYGEFGGFSAEGLTISIFKSDDGNLYKFYYF